MTKRGKRRGKKRNPMRRRATRGRKARAKRPVPLATQSGREEWVGEYT